MTLWAATYYLCYFLVPCMSFRVIFLLNVFDRIIVSTLGRGGSIAGVFPPASLGCINYHVFSLLTLLIKKE